MEGSDAIWANASTESRLQLSAVSGYPHAVPT